MLIFLIFTIICCIAYGFIISSALRYWKSIPIWNIPLDFIPKTVVSIIIPARNEADNIIQTLEAIHSQKYPSILMNIIVVDDHSEDDTVEIIIILIKKVLLIFLCFN